jgi:membrane-associated phospholipid phosphatase
MKSGEADERQRASLRAARAVSVLTFPPLVALPVFLALDVRFAGSGHLFQIVAATVAFGVAWPIAVSGLLISRRPQSSIESPREGLILLGLGALGYAIGVGTLVVIGSPTLVTLLMFCYGTNTAAMFAINVYWKASVHAMGIAGPTVALIFGFGVLGALLSLLLPLVGWSRIRSKAHTLSQVIVGAFLGYVLTGAQFVLGLRFF